MSVRAHDPLDVLQRNLRIIGFLCARCTVQCTSTYSESFSSYGICVSYLHAHYSDPHFS
jgi:hypothetical protein